MPEEGFAWVLWQVRGTSCWGNENRLCRGGSPQPRPWKCQSVSHSIMSTRLLFHGIFQAKILKWVAIPFSIPFSRGFSQLRDGTRVSCIAGGFFTIWASREALGKALKDEQKLDLQGLGEWHYKSTQVRNLKTYSDRTSLMVQWLRLQASNAGHAGSIPGQESEIPHAMAKKKKEIKCFSCRQAIARFCFYIQFDNLCLWLECLIRAFLFLSIFIEVFIPWSSPVQLSIQCKDF